MREQNMTISDSELYENGIRIPLTDEDFCTFVSKRTVTTAEAADMLNCLTKYNESFIV